MKLLSIDSSRKTQSVSIFDGADCLKTVEQDLKSSQLMPLLVGVFEDFDLKDMQALVTSIGPGSFTGIRTALSIVKTLASQLNLPTYAVNNFELLRFEQNLAADHAFAISAGTNDYFASLNSDYANLEANFYTTELNDLALYSFENKNLSFLLGQYLVANPALEPVAELEPYYLREPSVSKAKKLS